MNICQEKDEKKTANIQATQFVLGPYVTRTF